MLQYSPKIVTDSLVMCLDASNNKSYPTTDLPVKNGLVMWMDAADDTTFSYSSGTTVSQWRDKSGFNYHMVPVSAGPTRSSALNSRKILTFTTAQTIQNLSIDLRLVPYTVFVVSRLTGGANNRVLTCNANYTGVNWLLGHHGGTVNDYYAEGWVYDSATAADTTWRMFMGDWAKVPDLASCYSNGGELTIDSNAANGAPFSLGINILTAGASETSNCEVAEIIVFNRRISTAERRLVHTYLGQKWGISNTDRSIVDLSGNNNHGSFGGAAGSQTVANMPTFDFYNKGALRFDGTDDYVVGTVLSIAASSTVGMWIKSSNYDIKIPFSIAGSTYGSGPNIFFFSGLINWNTGDGAGNPFSNSSYLDSNWHYMVVTNDAATNAKLYIDGVLIGTAAYRNTISTNSNNLWLGRFSGNDVYNINGNIAGTQIYNKALSAAEVAQNYEAQKSKFANTIVQQGLVLNLDAGNPYSYAGAGTTFYDVSATALSWTINNATYNSSDPKYFSYNGSNSWLESSTSAAYDSQTITIECWFYPTTLTQDGFLFEKGQVNTQYSMFLASGNTFYFRTIGGTINNQDLTFASSTYLTANVWNHITCTYNGSKKFVYVNGIQAASVDASGTLNTGQINQYIGKYGAAGNNFPFNGRIAESRVYNIALSAAQVLQNYNATKGRFGLL